MTYVGIIIGIAFTLIFIFLTLAAIGWIKNRGRKNLPLTYRINDRWFWEICKFPRTLYKTWFIPGEFSLDINWYDWDNGLGKVRNPLKQWPISIPKIMIGDYLAVKGKWDKFIILVVTNYSEKTNLIETVALGYLDEKSYR